jgi:hypothetical protein
MAFIDAALQLPRPPVYELPHPRSVNSAEKDINITLKAKFNGKLTTRFEEVVHCREAFVDRGLQRAKSTIQLFEPPLSISVPENCRIGYIITAVSCEVNEIFTALSREYVGLSQGYEVALRGASHIRSTPASFSSHRFPTTQSKTAVIETKLQRLPVKLMTYLQQCLTKTSVNARHLGLRCITRTVRSPPASWATVNQQRSRKLPKWRLNYSSVL